MTAPDVRDRPRFDAVDEVRGRGAGRDEDQPVAGVERRALTRERDDGVSKRPEVWRAHEACRARCGSLNQCQAQCCQWLGA